MKYSLLFLFPILVGCSQAQTKHIQKLTIDSLAKYSYQVVGLIRDKGELKMRPVGTCFFIRRNGITFLVTAQHIVTGINVFNLQPVPNQYDTIAIVYNKFDSNKLDYQRITTAEIKKLIKPDYFYNAPDLIVVPLPVPYMEKYIYSIEKFMGDFVGDQPVKEDESLLFKNIEVAGYSYNKNDSFYMGNPPHHYAGIKGTSVNRDPFEKINDNIYYLTQPEAMQGMSGAPVFHKYISKKNKEYFTFAGVLFGSNYNYHSAYIVQTNQVEDSIRRYFPFR